MKSNVHIVIEREIHQKMKEKVNNFSAWVEQKCKEELGKTEMKFLLTPEQFRLHQFWENILCRYTPAVINLPELKKQIGLYFGLDDRTYRKYRDLLLEFDYLRPNKNSPNSWLIKRDYGWIAQEEIKKVTEDKEINDILSAKVVKND